MELRNETPFEGGFSIGMGPNRQACLAVLLKGTFTIPTERDARATEADEQMPLQGGAEFHKGDVTGSLLFETDHVVFKPRADIALNGKAYAPNGQYAKMVDVMLRVGRRRKIIRVFGDRQWVFPTRGVMIPVISDPKPFVEMPILYENAYGGFDRKAGKWCDKNFIGKGLLGKKTKESVDGQPLPNLEDPRTPITSWDVEPEPVGFGFYSPTWKPRSSFIGTEQGLEQPHPLFGLAADFKMDYFNAAHPELQVNNYLQGNEEVELFNVTRDGVRRFQLPCLRPTMTLHTYVDLPEEGAGDGLAGGEGGGDGAETAVVNLEERPTQAHPLTAPLDTLVFMPDDGVFYQVWRGLYPLGDFTEMEQLEQVIQNIAHIEIDMVKL